MHAMHGHRQREGTLQNSIRVKGKGMPDPRRRINGDQFVKINITTSDNKSKDFVLLMEKMKEILGEDINCSKFE